jgi:hypothetical protein
MSSAERNPKSAKYINQFNHLSRKLSGAIQTNFQIACPTELAGNIRKTRFPHFRTSQNSALLVYPEVEFIPPQKRPFRTLRILPIKNKISQLRGVFSTLRISNSALFLFHPERNLLQRSNKVLIRKNVTKKHLKKVSM